ncbi:MAG: hypothetical protein HKN48_09430, partial [Flavobacteriaceae bacterium]|nr:hypothetical protein [Flavobacteriaceae bacterium]
NTGADTPCEILPESSADFNLQPDQNLIAAYLYWAGSGAGDFDVTFNGNAITAERTFSFTLSETNVYFAGFADVTSIVNSTGNGTYTLSDLVPDLNTEIYCGGTGNSGNTTNFGGWAVTVIYEDATLPLNQVLVFDGMDGVFLFNPTIDIVLENLNVLDNTGAKIGFLAWEGDAVLANNETLRINGNILSNLPLNPPDNAFNSTNSFTGSSELYNMDIDFYDIENNINPGDESATISLTSNQDLVMVNNIITVLNNELPDGTIVMDNIVGGTTCGDRDLTIDYTVSNVNSTDALPAGTSIGFYANNTLIDQTETVADIPIDGSESGTINLTVPLGVPADFLLRAFVDDEDEVTELDEENNEDNTPFSLLVFPEISGVVDLELCDVVGDEIFDLTEATSDVDPTNTISYHNSEADAQTGDNPISDPLNYENTENPETIWIRVSNTACFVVGSFELEVIICPLPDATIEIDNEIYACRMRDLVIEYTVSNTDGTAPLPANTPISFYADLELIAQSATFSELPIGGSESNSITVTLSEEIPNTFVLFAVVDDTGDGSGVVEELNEFNNEFNIVAEFGTIPPITNLPDLTECDQGFEMAPFNLNVQDDLITQNTSGVFNYFLTEEDALANENPILDTGQFQNTSNPQTIYVRLENEICFTTASFNLVVERCPPVVYEGLSPNNDGMNDVFNINFIIDVFPDFNLKIYSREGNLIYEGRNEDGLWDGIPNTGLLYAEKVVPTGVYYYVLVLNDPDFPEPILGNIYVNY